MTFCSELFFSGVRLLIKWRTGHLLDAIVWHASINQYTVVNDSISLNSFSWTIVFSWGLFSAYIENYSDQQLLIRQISQMNQDSLEYMIRPLKVRSMKSWAVLQSATIISPNFYTSCHLYTLTSLSAWTGTASISNFLYPPVLTSWIFQKRHSSPFSRDRLHLLLPILSWPHFKFFAKQSFQLKWTWTRGLRC